MSPKKKKGRKERLKPLSFYGHDPGDVIRAFMQVDPEELKRLEKQDRIESETGQGTSTHDSSTGD